jgi:cell division protein FtsN
MEDDADYLDAYKSSVIIQKDPVEAVNFEVQKDAVEANVEEPPVKNEEKSEKAYSLQEEQDPVDTFTQERLVEAVDKSEEAFNLAATANLFEAATDETVMEGEEVHNLDVQEDPVEATTVIEELPMANEEESDKSSANDEEVEASPNKKKPYLDPLAKTPAEETVNRDGRFFGGVVFSRDDAG